MDTRQAELNRTTKETDITLKIQIDGSGTNTIDTGIPFLNHMLDLFSKHGLFDMQIKASGDLSVDYHHTIEDIGIVLGTAFDQALGEKKGIVRYGFASLPMDEARSEVAIDCGGRPYLIFDVDCQDMYIRDIPLQIFEEFFRGFAVSAKINLHIRMLYGVNPHHIIEGIFKSFARALDDATKRDPRKGDDIPSTKGII